MAEAARLLPTDRHDNLAAMLLDRRWRGAVEARFWPKVDRSSHPKGCWLWTASRRTEGYGRMKLASYVSDSAHRISYALHSDQSPGDLCVCHRCDNPRCVNPAHLFLGTHKDNSDDKIAKGRAKSAPQDGERNSAAKLSAADVDEIRARIRAGENNKAIAVDYGVTHQAVSRIRRGRSWGEAPIHQPYASLRSAPRPAVAPRAAVRPVPIAVAPPPPPPPAQPEPPKYVGPPIKGVGRKAILARYKAARGL